LPNIRYFGSRALSNCNVSTNSATYETNDALAVSGLVENFGDTWIGQSGWTTVTVGSPSQLNGLSYYPTFSSVGAYAPTGSGMLVRSNTSGLHYVYIYSSVLDDHYLETNTEAIASSYNRGVGGVGIEIRFNPNL
jgi:hypothetical protein